MYVPLVPRCPATGQTCDRECFGLARVWVCDQAPPEGYWLPATRFSCARSPEHVPTLTPEHPR